MNPSSTAPRPFNPRTRDLAYSCFLALGAAVGLCVLIDLAGPWLSRPLGAAVLLFLRLPVLGAGILAAVAGLALTLVVRRDPRLYMLSMAALTLMVFWVRQPALGVPQAWALLYIPGSLLFSLRWWVTRHEAPAAPRSTSGPY